MNRSILLIGAGQLGSRHLQALAQLNNTFCVFVVDPSSESLEIAEQRYLEVKLADSPLAKFITNLDAVQGKTFDVCIVSTSAAIRLEVVKKMLKTVDVQYVLLEKVLFQSTNQLLEAEKILVDNGVKTWVNFPRRQFESYQALAQKYQNAKSVSVTVEGSNWGLACNAIHFIDLWHYFAGFADYSLDFTNNTYVIDSKRIGYKELIGGLMAKSQNGNHKLDLRCTAEGPASLKITAKFDQDTLEISEENGLIHWVNTSGETYKTVDLEVLYQSQLTNKVVTSLIDTGNCELTLLSDSIMLHSQFLNEALPLFSNQKATELDLVPIT